MQAEREGRAKAALALFLAAWEMRQDEWEACVAAHFLARQQPTLADTLRWNEEALRRADAVGEARIRDFYPSLYLNLGACHEALGDLPNAHICYEQAAVRLDALPDSPYGSLIHDGIQRALQRVQTGA